MLKFKAPAAAMALALTGAVLGQGAAPTFASLDKNSDGQISLNEASVDDELFTEFKKLDTNKDGVLSKEEFAAYKKS